MDLKTIEMDEADAREAAEAYSRDIRGRRREEDSMLATAYRELARGKRLIKLTDALRAGGVSVLTVPDHLRWNADDPRTRYVSVPRIAVCPADASHAWTNGIRSDGSLRIQGAREVHSANRKNVIRLPEGTFDVETDRVSRSGGWGQQVEAVINAVLPIVPPPLRPAHHLRNYTMLWEAEWAFDPSAPPVDPALLKHIGGDLYAVLAVWDLTEIERAVLAGREPA